MLGFQVDCASPLQYYTSPLCWWKTLDDWVAGNLQFTQAAVAAAGSMPYMLPAAPSTLTQETVPGAFTPEQAIAQGDVAQTQALSDYFARVSQALSTGAGTGINPQAPVAPDYTWVWVAGIGAVLLLFLVRR
jgi:hypothetical protein